MDDNFHSLQEKNAYIRKNPLYIMMIERNSFLTHRRQFPENSRNRRKCQTLTGHNGIQFLNIYDFLLGDSLNNAFRLSDKQRITLKAEVILPSAWFQKCCQFLDFLVRSTYTLLFCIGSGLHVLHTCSDLYFLGRIFKEWEGIKTFGYIDNWRINKATGEDVTERHYFITSLENDPKRILKFKRKHWGIENGLHWQLDVNFNEDDDRKRKNSAQNYSLIVKMTLNILKNHQHKDKKASIKRKRMKAAWDEDYLKSLLTNWLKAF